ATTAPPATTAPRPPATIAWPAGKRGWTIVLLSIPQGDGGRAAAEARAAEARRKGLTDVGVLNSSRFASLHPGYYAVFTGVFDSEAEATSALPRARAAFPLAYSRPVVP
ncbi:MAG: SPOR domain-containing protein, partial [Actinobacteria bacterium]|nr:SPOR domain-containing protein [Actinomycetota bacterium]